MSEVKDLVIVKERDWKTLIAGLNGFSRTRYAYDQQVLSTVETQFLAGQNPVACITDRDGRPLYALLSYFGIIFDVVVRDNQGLTALDFALVSPKGREQIRSILVKATDGLYHHRYRLKPGLVLVDQVDFMKNMGVAYKSFKPSQLVPKWADGLTFQKSLTVMHGTMLPNDLTVKKGLVVKASIKTIGHGLRVEDRLTLDKEGKAGGLPKFGLNSWAKTGVIYDYYDYNLPLSCQNIVFDKLTITRASANAISDLNVNDSLKIENVDSPKDRGYLDNINVGDLLELNDVAVNELRENIWCRNLQISHSPSIKRMRRLHITENLVIHNSPNIEFDPGLVIPGSLLINGEILSLPKDCVVFGDTHLEGKRDFQIPDSFCCLGKIYRD